MAADPKAGAAGAVSASQLKHVTALPAFASIIDTYVVPGHEELNANLLEAIAAMPKEKTGMTASNQLGWHSDRDFFSRDEPAFRQLQKHVWEALTKSVRRYWADFDPVIHQTQQEGWVNVNGRGAFNVPHDHALHHLSGCYYVATPQSEVSNSGLIEFLNPAGALSPTLIFSERMMRKKLTVRPSAGQILLFPSYLQHWVYPNQEDEERVSIAFNLSVLEFKTG